MCLNGVQIYQFKAKDSEIKPYPLCLDNISKDFTGDDLENTGLNSYEWFFYWLLYYWC